MKLKLIAMLSLLTVGIHTTHAGEQEQERALCSFLGFNYGGFQSQLLAENFNSLNAVSEAVKKRVNLTQARITYGMFSVGAGNASIYLNTADDKIVDLNIDAAVGMLGMNSNIKQKITIAELKNGNPLEFYMDGADSPALKVTPAPGFSETGGKATLEIWDGDRFKKETIVISKMSGEYKLYLNSVTRDNRISGININMRGYSIPNMYVDDYKIKTN